MRSDRLDEPGAQFAEALADRLDAALIAGRWSFVSSGPTTEIILPDGCRDAIFAHDACGRLRLFFSPLGTAPELKAIGPNTAMTGIRLAPSVLGGEGGVVRSPLAAAEAVASALSRSAALDEALAALRTTANPKAAAKALGVTLRTLQRLTSTHSGKPPGFWAGIGRARRAAQRMILEDTPLCELAVDAGFSDQSHMTREVSRWFGASPKRIRRCGRNRRHPLSQLTDRGYEAVDTGEQISTR